MTHKPKINKYLWLSAGKSWRFTTSTRHKLVVLFVFALCILPANLCGQSLAIKSNLLYDLTTSLNLGGEIRCDDTHTFSLSVNYNPWNFSGNKKMKHNFGGMLPWGFGNGKMLGIENRQIANNRYQGNLAGFGISYGYQWMISPQWNMEAGISLGYAHLNYKRYGQPAGAPLIEKSNCNYWGPTQIGISVVYFIQ